MKSLLSLLSVLLLGVGAARAQKPFLKLEADSQKIMIGYPFHLKMRMGYPAGTECQWPSFVDSIDANFEIVGLPHTDTISASPDIQLAVTYPVTAFKGGIFTLGPFPFRYAEQGILVNDTSNALTIEVRVPEVDTTKGFMDIQGPVEVPLSWKEFIKPVLIAAGIILAFVLSVLLALVWIRRRRARLAALPPEPEVLIPPYDEAREALQHLRNEQAAGEWDVKLYYTALTDILRRYLERVLDIPAPEMISDEIIQAMRRKGTEISLQQLAAEVLQHADLAKFAKGSPDELLRTHDLDRVSLLVEKMRPRETEGGDL